MELIAFSGHQRIARGAPDDVISAATAAAKQSEHRIAVYNAHDGSVVDLDPREDLEAAVARISGERRGRGRPKLGVVSREITLLPEQWQWLSAQPQSVSATLRRLIFEERQRRGAGDERKQAIDAAYRFVSDLDANLPQFEAVSRHLFAGEFDEALALCADWPADVRETFAHFLPTNT